MLKFEVLGCFMLLKHKTIRQMVVAVAEFVICMIRLLSQGLSNFLTLGFGGFFKSREVFQGIVVSVNVIFQD